MLYFLMSIVNLTNKSVHKECDTTDKIRNHVMNLEGKTELEKAKWEHHVKHYRGSPAQERGHSTEGLVFGRSCYSDTSSRWSQYHQLSRLEVQGRTGMWNWHGLRVQGNLKHQGSNLNYIQKKILEEKMEFMER